MSRFHQLLGAPGGGTSITSSFAAADVEDKSNVLTSTGPITLRWVGAFVASVWCGNLFMSFLQQLCAAIFFFRASAVDGDDVQPEALFVAFSLSPLLGSFLHTRDALRRHTHWLIVVASCGHIAAFSTNPYVKLISFALAFSCIYLFEFMAWTSVTPQRERAVFAFFLGILLHLVLRFAYFSADPLHISLNWSIAGFIVTPLCASLLYIDKRPALAARSYDICSRILFRVTCGFVCCSACTQSDDLDDADGEGGAMFRQHSSITSRSTTLLQSPSPFLHFASSIHAETDHFDGELDDIPEDDLEASMYTTGTPVALSPSRVNDSRIGGIGLILSSGVDVYQSRQNTTERVVAPLTWLQCIRIGVAFGSLQFTTQCLMSTHGVIPRWAGLDPFPHGLTIIALFGVGVLFAKSRSLHSAITCCLLVVGGGLLCFGVAAHTIMLGGALIALLTAPAWFALICDLPSRCPPPTIFITGFVWGNLLYHCMTASEYKVAMFENNLLGHAHVVVFVAILGMSLSFGSHVLTKPSVQIHFPPLPVIMCVFALIVAGMLPSALQRAQGRSPDSSSSFIPLNPPIGIVMFDQVGASVTDVPAYHAVIALQYNIQNGFTSHGLVNVSALAELMFDLRATLIALENCDTVRIWSSNLDVVEYVSWYLGYRAAVGETARHTVSGVAVLTTWQIESFSGSLLPKLAVDRAPLLDVLLRAPPAPPTPPQPAPNGTTPSPVHPTNSPPPALLLRTMVTRLTPGNDAKSLTAREAQVQHLAKYFASQSASQPMMLLGDLGGTPDDAALQPLISTVPNAMSSFTNGTYVPTTDDQRTLDYIFFRKMLVDYASVAYNAEFFDHKPLEVIVRVCSDLCW